jgi:hypothetical protein
MSKVAEHVGVESVEAAPKVKSSEPAVKVEKPVPVTGARVREIAKMVSGARTVIRHWRVVVGELERVAEQLESSGGGHK